MIAENLNNAFQRFGNQYEEAALRVLRSGNFISGTEVKNFENEFARFCGAKYCVGLANGYDALFLTIKSLGIGAGDQVIVPANTYIATVLAVSNNNATPVFVEPDKYFNIDADKIEEKITEHTKAVLAVNLYGQSANYDKIVDICQRRNIQLVEDCAQSHNARYKGKMSGTFGVAGCFSFYPTKNMGAFGDAGAVVTDNELIYRQLKTLHNYGSDKKYYNSLCGVNSRLDEIQAALLRVKLGHINEITEIRKQNAELYLAGIKNDSIILPLTLKGAQHVYHQFVIRCKKRNRLMNFLKGKGINADIHYPVPPHLQQCYRYLGYKKGDFPFAEQLSDEVLSLPVGDGVSQNDIQTVIDALNDF